MKHQPGMAIERGSGVGHYSFPSQSVGCSRRWSQPCGTSLTKSLAPLQGISDGNNLIPFMICGTINKIIIKAWVKVLILIP